MTSVWAGGMLLLIALPSVVSQNRRGDPLQPNWQGPELDGRENAQSRAWVPNNELPLPSSWTWNEYKSKLLEKDIDTGSYLLPLNWKWDKYHSDVEVASLLVSLQTKCPTGLAAPYTLGLSEEGRAMIALEMGSRVRGTDSTATLIPVVKLAANMHGDERAGTEVLLRFAWDLCRRFAAKEESIVRLLGTTSIHILPSINPDGSARRQRFNARLKDLNREFPSLGLSRTYGVRSGDLPKEVMHVMNWHLEHDFVLAANLHGGALVASYPMDACDEAGVEKKCPSEDDPLPLRLARVIADSHGRMAEMPGGPSFDRGVTRGSEWYPILGGMQDWVWHATSCTELTVEVHEAVEWNDIYAPRLPWLYLEMRDSLLRFITQAHIAIKGTVVDETDGEAMPLDASVTLTTASSTSPGRTTRVSSGRSGSFFRLVVPGMQYCLKVEAPGYLPQYAAVMMPKDAAADANSTIVHFFKMSKTNRVPVATLGAGKIDSCPVDDTNVKAAPQSSDKHLVTLSCSETELKEQPDGGFELVCINYCNELEMMPGDKRSTFRAMCIGND